MCFWHDTEAAPGEYCIPFAVIDDDSEELPVDPERDCARRVWPGEDFVASGVESIELLLGEAFVFLAEELGQNLFCIAIVFSTLLIGFPKEVIVRANEAGNITADKVDLRIRLKILAGSLC